MMKKVKLCVALVFVFCLGISSSALANGILTAEWGVGNFDKIVQISTDPIFTSPGIELRADYTQLHAANLSVPYDQTVFDTWTVSFDASGKSVSAEGNSLSVLAWFLNIDTAYENTPFSFEFYAYNNNVLVDWATVSYDGGVHGASTHGSALNNGDNYTFAAHNLNQVPEPVSLLLLGLGLLGIVPLRKKIK